MAVRKFSSDQVIKFNKRQVYIIRKHSDSPITHNFMGRITDFDHFKVGSDLDFASWDSYPLGFLEDRVDTTEVLKKEFSRQGDSAFQAFHHDLYRSVGRGRWWIMEQQPGPVNWAPYNPNPLKGMVKLWSWEAFAHGAEAVLYFRWRQAPFGQEQMHSGLHLPDGSKSPAYYEVKELSEELKKFNEIQECLSSVAIIFDYDANSAWETQPHGENLHYFNLIFDFYEMLLKLRQSIDILPSSHQDFSNYNIGFGPGLIHMNENLKRTLSEFDRQVFLGPRTSTREKNLKTPIPLPPNLTDFDAKIVLTESLRSDSPIALEQGGHFYNYREILDGTASVVEKTVTGEPAIVRGGI